jgi:hypothetical protein
MLVKAIPGSKNYLARTASRYISITFLDILEKLITTSKTFFAVTANWFV